tara:strand:- start:43 stop:498 length:456 start_codon:yes stop_codon:yes gene_type:complete
MKKHYLRSTRNLYYIDEKPNLRVYYSYSTPVALMIDGHLKVSQNRWSITTAKHLTWIDGGNKKSRLKKEDFQKLLDEHKPQPKHDFLKTVGTMSALFGLMSKGEDKKKVNNQKKRFFNHVEGLHFPEDWDTLTEEEKEKRLNKVEQVAISQ